MESSSVRKGLVGWFRGNNQSQCRIHRWDAERGRWRMRMRKYRLCTRNLYLFIFR